MSATQAMCQGRLREELLARSCGLAPQPDCDLALALMHFPPKSSGCHCLLRLLLNSHLPSLTRPGSRGSRGSRRDGGFLEDLTQVTEPSPPSTGQLLVALLQADCCDKLFSRVWGSFSVHFTRLRSPEFLFVFDKEVDVLGWHMYTLSIWVSNRQEDGGQIE